MEILIILGTIYIGLQIFHTIIFGEYAAEISAYRRDCKW